MFRLHHPHIVSSFGGSVMTKSVQLVMEVMVTSLHRELHEKKTSFAEQQRREVILHVARGLTYLHVKGITHRDLKPHNLMQDEFGTWKLIDFGMAKSKSTSRKVTKRTGANQGTQGYMAPELYTPAGGNHKVDNFAFGITIWELYAEEEPFAGIADLAIGRMVEKNKRPPIEAVKEKDIKQLIKACWHQKPGKRPEMADVVGVIECAMSTALVEAESGGGGSATKKERGWFRPVSGEHYMDALIEDVDSEDELDV